MEEVLGFKNGAILKNLRQVFLESLRSWRPQAQSELPAKFQQPHTRGSTVAEGEQEERHLIESAIFTSLPQIHLKNGRARSTRL